MASEASPVPAPGGKAKSDENILNIYHALDQSPTRATVKAASKLRTQRIASSYTTISLCSSAVELCVSLAVLKKATSSGTYVEEAINFGEVAVQQEAEVDDRDLSSANIILESCQAVLKEAKAAAAAAIESEEDSDEALDEDLDEDLDGEVVVWDPDWSEERKAAATASWSAQPAQAVPERSE